MIGGIELSLACLLGCFLTGYLAGKPKASRALRAPHAPAASLSCERSAAASGAQPPAGAAVADIRVGQTRQGPQKAGTALPACFDCHAVQPCARPRATPIHQPPTCPSDTPARLPGEGATSTHSACHSAIFSRHSTPPAPAPPPQPPPLLRPLCSSASGSGRCAWYSSSSPAAMQASGLRSGCMHSSTAGSALQAC